MQTTGRKFLLRDLITLLSPRGRELLVGLYDPCELIDSVPITGARILELASETELVFCKKNSNLLTNVLLQSHSRFIVTDPEVYSDLPEVFRSHRAFLLTDQPRLLLSMLLVPFVEPAAIVWQSTPVHPSAKIASDVVLARGTLIGPHVIIESGCTVGPNTVIDHAVIGADTHIGANCTIGGDGFGFEIDERTGSVIKFPHFGSVYIGKRGDIASNVAIDRGSLRDTILEDEVKVDNLVYIAHNCHIKRGALIMANATLLGSVTVGEYAWIAPSTSVLNGTEIGRCGMTGVGSVVIHAVGSNEVVVGSPAHKLRDRLPADSPLLRYSDKDKDGQPKI